MKKQQIMRRNFLIALLAVTFLLTACVGEDNPLTEVSPKVLAKEIFCIKEDTNDCMDFWENPASTSKEGMLYQSCEDGASKIAIQLTKSGYGEISPKNVKSLENWAVIKEEIQILRTKRRELMPAKMKYAMTGKKVKGVCD